MQVGRTTRTATKVRSERTFRSAPYLEGLFGGTRVDAYLQAEICARIKHARKEAGFTQEDMAALLNLTTRAYQNYERVRVPFRRMGDIARLTGKTEAWLLHGDPAEPAEGDMAQVRELLEAQQRTLDELVEAVAHLRRGQDGSGQGSG